jgi:hypothetical protein
MKNQSDTKAEPRTVSEVLDEQLRVVRLKKLYTVTAEGWPYTQPPMPIKTAIEVARKRLRSSKNRSGAKSVTITLVEPS